MGRSVHSSETAPSNLWQLRVGILSSWVNVPPQRFQQPIESASRRISAVIKARGGSTRFASLSVLCDNKVIFLVRSTSLDEYLLGSTRMRSCHIIKHALGSHGGTIMGVRLDNGPIVDDMSVRRMRLF
ncbi:hypothetical protein AVEN_68582-1 [Araneus ventricosus]|uniref:Uncharacterized protein n=1 Tax=Araneus ventricosus TaxID=182803 RepID=A0A4Y2FJH1_ARAVE|nr:hypothetical protein AVEN_68582-1 [Araneus ventricosus]